MPTTHYLWDFASDNLLMEKDVNGTMVATYSHEPGLHGQLTSQYRNGQTYYHHLDGNGNSRAVTDQNSDVVEAAAYSAFGELVDKSSSIVNPFGYRGAMGYFANPVTQDIDVRARIYIPPLGRWLSQDPVGMSLTPHAYVYALNCPITYCDPSGEKAIVEGLVLAIACGIWAGICRNFWERKDREYGVAPITKDKEECLIKAARYAYGGGVVPKCLGRIKYATAGNPPETVCHAGCLFLGTRTYLGPENIQCGTCESYLQTVMTLAHECVHHRQFCLQPNCMEWEAYNDSIMHMDTWVRQQCGRISRQGLCPSAQACNTAIDKIIQNDRHELEIYRQKCFGEDPSVRVAPMIE